jgi:formylglycine-generating enzyme required for sulfatase activity
VTRVRAFGTIGCIALGCVAFGGACAGDSFELGPDALSQGGSGFPPLGTTDNTPDGGLGGRGGAPASTLSDCGELRPSTPGDDGEVCIAAGTFTMGNDEVAVPEGYSAHFPAHSVTLAAFVIDAKEVTVARYRACVNAGTCSAPRAEPEQGCSYSAASGAADRLPVTCVSWDDAVTFCEWDARRLPTEAEWERATRGTTGRLYAWGDEVACINAVFGGVALCPEHAGVLPQPVGSTPRGASPEGALDLIGNAWEWVNDWSGPYPNGAVENPMGPTLASGRVQRGGNWQTPPALAVGFMRRAVGPSVAAAPSSFRCARNAAN